jgi:hypothetical protein
MKFSKDFSNKREVKFNLEREKDPVTNRSEFDDLEDLAKLKNSSLSKITREIILDYFAKNPYIISNNDTPKIEEFIKEDGTEKHYNEPTVADYTRVHQEFIINTDLPLEELERRANACLTTSKLYTNAYEVKKDAEFERLREARLNAKLSPQLKNEELGPG